jgi:hypothetical protein
MSENEINRQYFQKTGTEEVTDVATASPCRSTINGHLTLSRIDRRYVSSTNYNEVEVEAIKRRRTKKLSVDEGLDETKKLNLTTQEVVQTPLVYQPSMMISNKQKTLTDTDTDFKLPRNIPNWVHVQSRCTKQNESGKCLTYYNCYCKYCAEFKAHNAWATLKLRRDFSYIGPKHENSSDHRLAESLYNDAHPT